MKVETPQILWNSDGDKGRNAPLYSVAMQESGIAVDENACGHVLATAGNTSVINLWKVSFAALSEGNARDLFHNERKPLNKIEYMTSLARHDLPINTVTFSPDGLHLATAGEAGTLVIWSVPVSKRGNGNGKHFWCSVKNEKDLSVRIVSTHCEGVCDLSWSSDSKRFIVGTIDSQVLVFEDKHYSHNRDSPETHQKESEWQSVFRNGEHGAFVQGVSYDPLGVYLASMGSDRSVRLFVRKIPPKSKKKVLRPSNAKGDCAPPLEHQQLVSKLLTDSKVEIGKTKRIKQRSVIVDEKTGAQIKQRLFVDESTCESFFRRLSWTADGAYLVTPAALRHSDDSATSSSSSSSSPSFATLLFSRHRFDEPCRVLPGLDKPSVVVRPNPVLFELPGSSSSSSSLSKATTSEAKENESPMTNKAGRILPYRSIFAVMTLDSVLVYDTHHSHPLSIVRGLHYTGLTDCCWSKDGHSLVVCSTDGYLSIINFGPDELGKVYQQPRPPVASPLVVKQVPGLATSPIPPCRPGPAVLESRPTKKARITPTLVTTTTTTTTAETAASPASTTISIVKSPSHKRSRSPETTESVGDAVNKLSLDNRIKAVAAAGEKPKKKKRIQPFLIST